MTRKHEKHDAAGHGAEGRVDPAGAGPAGEEHAGGAAAPGAGQKPGAPAEAGAAAEPAGEAKIRELEGEIERLKDRLLRLQADFDNYRKRTGRERDEVVRRANENLLLELIAVLDNLDFGLRRAVEQEGGEAFAQGLRLVAQQLMEVVQRFGLRPMDARDQAFDPQFHEAVMHIPSEHEEGRVIDQTRRGYLLGDKLLRPAGVVVSSGRPAAASPEDSAGDEPRGTEG